MSHPTSTTFLCRNADAAVVWDGRKGNLDDCAVYFILRCGTEYLGTEQARGFHFFY